MQIPAWAIKKVQSKVLNSHWEDPSNNNLQPTGNNTNNSMEQQTQTGTTTTTKYKQTGNPGANTGPTSTSRPNSTVGHVVIPYTQGLVESFKNICGKYGIQTYFKGNTTI